MSILLQCTSEICGTERAAAVSAVANANQIRLILSDLQVSVPGFGAPSPAPSFHIQPRGYRRGVAMDGCGRPRPIRRPPHQRGTNWVEFYIAQSFPVGEVHGTAE
jgi:hypothetical protein